MNKGNAISNVKIKRNGFRCYVPHYAPSIPQQAILSKLILSKTPRELQHVERNVFSKEIKSQIFWTFELGSQEGINVPLWIIVGFQQKDRHESRNLNNDTFLDLQ